MGSMFKDAAIVFMLALVPMAAQASSYDTLYSFSGTSDGSTPQGPLLYYRGMFYGVTHTGGLTKKGAAAYGTIFRYDPVAGSLTTLYTFQGSPDGAGPTMTLAALGGTLYGATQSGGASNNGALFSVNAGSGKETLLYSFAGGSTDGKNPSSGLTYANGMFFGLTANGGNDDCTPGCGTVYTLDPATGLKATAYYFDATAGAYPSGDLVLVHNQLYGTAMSGGAVDSDGTIYSIDPVGNAVTLQYSFTQKTGPRPISLTPKGALFYGTTADGNPNEGIGSLFVANLATGHVKTLHLFQGGKDGGNPNGAMVPFGGLLYGTTSGADYSADTVGKDNVPGTIYSLNTSTKTQTTVYDFPLSPEGGGGGYGLTVVNGALYGVTSGLGANNAGSIFRFVP